MKVRNKPGPEYIVAIVPTVTKIPDPRVDEIPNETRSRTDKIFLKPSLSDESRITVDIS
jgi:hypothetical protein